MPLFTPTYQSPIDREAAQQAREHFDADMDLRKLSPETRARRAAFKLLTSAAHVRRMSIARDPQFVPTWESVRDDAEGRYGNG